MKGRGGEGRGGEERGEKVTHQCNDCTFGS